MFIDLIPKTIFLKTSTKSIGFSKLFPDKSKTSISSYGLLEHNNSSREAHPKPHRVKPILEADGKELKIHKSDPEKEQLSK